MVGWLGPHRSMSSTPTSRPWHVARHRPRLAVTVLLPTPPLPDRISTLCLTPANLSAIRWMSGSGPALEQLFWLGHPSHAEALPDCSVPTPGQCSGTFSSITTCSAISVQFCVCNSNSMDNVLVSSLMTMF